MTFCTDSRADGQAPLRWMLMRSAKAEVLANAQQPPLQCENRTIQAAIVNTVALDA